MLWNPKYLGIRKAILESGGKGYFMSDAVNDDLVKYTGRRQSIPRPADKIESFVQI